jgi:hypothetical protein
VPTKKDATEVSPWLELTRWPNDVQGHRFNDLVPLASLPDHREPLPFIIEGSIELLIQDAYQSIKEHRINEFDQI